MARNHVPPRWLTGLLMLGAIALAWTIERPRRRPALRRALALPPLDPADAPTPPAARGFAPDAVAPGRVPVRARRWSWEWWKRVLINTYAEINQDRLMAVAAGVVFFGLLAIFPAISAFVSLYGLIATPATITDHLSMLANIMPAGGLDIVQEQVGRILAKGEGTLSFGFVAGFLLALWSANAGVKAMMDALNVIEDETESRSFVRLNMLSLSFTLGAIVFLLLAIGAVVAFPLVMSAFGLTRIVDTMTWLVRWPVLLALALFGLAVLYRFGPSRSHRSVRWRWISPGSVFATLAWIAGSAALSLYLSYFADYDATYGSLGAGIGLMMWMWLSTMVVLVGAELDSEIDKLDGIYQPAP